MAVQLRNTFGQQIMAAIKAREVEMSRWEDNLNNRAKIV